MKKYLCSEMTIEKFNEDMLTYGYATIDSGEFEFCKEVVDKIQELLHEYEILIIPEDQVVNIITSDKSILPMTQFTLQKYRNKKLFPKVKIVKLLMECFGHSKEYAEKIYELSELNGSAIIATMHKEHAELRDQKVNEFNSRERTHIYLIVRGV